MNRIKAIDLYNENYKIDMFYNRIREGMLERTNTGQEKYIEVDCNQDAYKDMERVLEIFKEDGFYIECLYAPNTQISVIEESDRYKFLIAWDERSPAVKYRVDGEEYQKAHNSIVCSSD